MRVERTRFVYNNVGGHGEFSGFVRPHYAFCVDDVFSIVLSGLVIFSVSTPLLLCSVIYVTQCAIRQRVTLATPVQTLFISLLAKAPVSPTKGRRRLSLLTLLRYLGRATFGRTYFDPASAFSASKKSGYTGRRAVQISTTVPKRIGGNYERS